MWCHSPFVRPNHFVWKYSMWRTQYSPGLLAPIWDLLMRRLPELLILVTESGNFGQNSIGCNFVFIFLKHLWNLKLVTAETFISATFCSDSSGLIFYAEIPIFSQKKSWFLSLHGRFLVTPGSEKIIGRVKTPRKWTFLE